MAINGLNPKGDVKKSADTVESNLKTCKTYVK